MYYRYFFVSHLLLKHLKFGHKKGVENAFCFILLPGLGVPMRRIKQ